MFKYYKLTTRVDPLFNSINFTSEMRKNSCFLKLSHASSNLYIKKKKKKKRKKETKRYHRDMLVTKVKISLNALKIFW